jgi:SlyX protein
MPSSIDTEQRFIDLEIKIGFMEDLLDNLNALVARQQQHIDLLVKEVSALRRQQDDGGGSPGFRSLRDELPPHY